MKHILSIAIIILSIITIQAQTIKNYSGPYKDKVVYQFPSSYADSDIGTGFKYGGISGNANYEYFENSNLERIFQGKFTLTTSGTYSTSISGSYKNNLKDGYWKYNLNRRDQDNTNFSPCTEIAEGNYNQGKLNGNWSYNLIDKKTGKKYYSSKAQFSNNIMIGLFEFTANNLYKYEFKINYDSLGDLNGNYNVKYWVHEIPFEDIRVYKHGKLISSIHRNMSTGDVINSNVYNYENGNFWDLYTALSFWGCNDSGYNGCERGDNPIFRLAKGTNLDQTNVLKEEDIKRKRLLQSKLEAEEKQLKQEEDYKNYIVAADNDFKNKNYELAHTAYINASKIKENEQYPKEKIKETEIKLKEIETKLNELKQIQIKYDLFISNGNSARDNKKYELAINEYKNALELKNENYPKEQIEQITHFISDFLTERSKTTYDLEKENIETLTSIKENVNSTIIENLKSSKYDELELDGDLLFVLDTNGVVAFDYSQVKCETNKFITMIKNNIHSATLKPIYKNGYKINCNGKIDIKTRCYRGKTIISYIWGNKKSTFRKSVPKPEVQSAIISKMTSTKKYYPNDYTMKYEYYTVGELYIFNMEEL